MAGVTVGRGAVVAAALYEENTLPTPHDKIKVFAGNSLERPDMHVAVEMFRALSTARDEQALLIEFRRLVPDCGPSTEFLKRVLAYPDVTDARPPKTAAAREMQGGGSGPSAQRRAASDPRIG